MEGAAKILVGLTVARGRIDPPEAPGVIRHLGRVVQLSGMGLEFEWDQDKAWQNIEKRDKSFEEAATVLGEPLSNHQRLVTGPR